MPLGNLATATSKCLHLPPKATRPHKVYGRAVGGSANAVTLQTAESSLGVTIAYNSATGQYLVTLPGKGSCKLGPILVSFEGEAAKTAKVESRDESTRSFVLTVQNSSLADVTLAAEEYLNFEATVHQV